MAKKKKTQLKPVARGFATVSVPKKIASVEGIEGKSVEDTVGSSSRGVGGEPENTRDGQSQPGVTSDFDVVKTEEKLLQSLVDRHQEKTEKEVLRYAPTFDDTPMPLPDNLIGLLKYALLVSGSIEGMNLLHRALKRTGTFRKT
jgi:protein-tyrosine phosphatase